MGRVALDGRERFRRTRRDRHAAGTVGFEAHPHHVRGRRVVVDDQQVTHRYGGVLKHAMPPSHAGQGTTVAYPNQAAGQNACLRRGSDVASGCDNDHVAAVCT